MKKTNRRMREFFFNQMSLLKINLLNNKQKISHSDGFIYKNKKKKLKCSIEKESFETTKRQI
jgi:hypothetical protein